MTLRVSYSFLILAQFIVVISAQSCGLYNNSWFGAECQYKCQCNNNVTCNVTNGDCPSGCNIGWFGPACQYADLASDATIQLTGDVSQDMTLMTDGDDTTCTTFTGSNLSLNVTWAYDVYITWLRIVVSNTEFLPVNISITFTDDATTQSLTCVNVFVDKLTADIYCNISQPIRALVISGSGVHQLCSLYVSKGRNVALKQLTNQTSTDPGQLFYVPSSAVDGYKGSFTHTNESGEAAPTWTLIFQSTVTVTSYTIYNRIQPDKYRTLVLNRLKGFILRTFDQTIKIVQNYTDHEPLGLEVYNILSTDPWAQVLYVQITATNPSETLILSLSEVEIYGDSKCPGDKLLYGRDCENLCNCDVPGEKCFVSTGNCPSGCKAGYYGQGCTNQCETGYFGIDCRNYCSNCSRQQCDGVDGKCLSCALKGKKRPYCSDDCDPGFYGSDCKSNCSQNCVQNGSICDVIEGKCLKCKTGFYGNNCTTSCSPNCKDSMCDASTGNCVSCKPGYYGMTCDNVCSKNCKESLCEINSGNCSTCNYGFYGPNCWTHCPLNCKDSDCDFQSGNCVSCNTGFYGKMCNNTCSNNCKETICEIKSGKCTICNSGFYGPNCMTSCPTNCKDSVCELNSGMCISCRPGFKGDQCKEECSSFTYGEHCKISCNPNCNINFTDVRVCDSNDGHCLNGCRIGYAGDDCSQVKSQFQDVGRTDYERVLASGIGIGIGITIAVGIVLGIFIFIWFKRRQKPPTKPPATTNRPYDHVDPIQQNEHDYQTVDKSGDGYDLITESDIVSFNKKTNSVITGDGKQNYENITCKGVSQ